MASENPFWADPRFKQFAGNALSDLGFGLATSPQIGNVFGASTQRMQAMQPARDAETERQRQIQEQTETRNQTLEWLAQNQPDLAGMVQSGMPVDEAWNTAIKRMQPGAGAEQPATVREWEYFSGLTPEQQGDYLRMKRANPYLDVGTGFVQPDPLNPGQSAGPAIPIDNRTPARDKAIGEGEGKFVVEAKQAAADARQSLQATAEARKLLDSGMITGFGADAIVGFGKALQQVGINLAPDAIANTEAFVATRALEVGRLIQLFGAGTGLSDADREFATKAAAGQIQMTEQSIRKILDINERASRNVLARYDELSGATPSPAGAGAPTGGIGGTTSTGLPWSIE